MGFCFLLPVQSASCFVNQEDLIKGHSGPIRAAFPDGCGGVGSK